MPYKVTKEQAQAMAHKPDISGEYKEKIAELTRRLGANGFNYERDWDTMAFTAQQAFIEGLFLDGLAATSVGDYVESAAQSCGCPDVVEDLHWHSPALMGEIEKVNQPAEARYISEGLRVLNELLDRQVEQVFTEGPASEKVQRSEQEIIDNLAATGIVGSMLVADANSNGPDAQFIIDGQPFWLEIKENTNAQMGDGSITYYPGNPDGERFAPAKPEKFGDDGWTVTHAALREKEEDILAWVTALIDPARPASSKWRSDDGALIPGAKAMGTFQTTYRAYAAAQQAGLQNKASAGFGRLPPVEAPASYIDKIYASKKQPIYYIQVGGKGLYYLDGNPANLPVPHFAGVIGVELRPRPSGRAKVKDKETGEVSYKHWESPVDPEDKVVYYSGAYSATARFKSRDVEPSPYTFEEVEGPRGIKAMLAAMNQQPQEPERPQAEPEEDKDFSRPL